MLIEQARKAREKAFAPYSDYTVGASVLGDNGKIYQGANVEVACVSHCGILFFTHNFEA